MVCDSCCVVRLPRRVGRIEEELPDVLEFLALCLSAGENILDSVRRVRDVGAGELTAELRGVVVAVGTGSSLGSWSLSPVVSRSRRCPARSISSSRRSTAARPRARPALAGAGRPRRRQAPAHRTGWRKEIYMLVPLVFLILP